MSAVKFQSPAPYKLFEPEFPQRPIIVVDEGLDSPETITLKYEEAEARARSGGGLRGDSPPGLLPMSYGKAQPTQLHGFDASRDYQEPSYQSYNPQSFAPQVENAPVGQDSFTGSAGVGQYVTEPVVFSCQPETGVAGTKVLLKVSCGYDLLSMTQSTPYFHVVFGSHKCQAVIMRDSPDGSTFAYTVTAEAPHPTVTNCPSPSVPLELVIDDPSGQEISRTGAGQFVYHEGPVEGAAENVTRERKRSGAQPQPATSPKSAGPDPTTNTFAYPTAPEASQQSPYAASFSQGSENMITTYSRSSSFTDPFPRVPPSSSLRSPAAAWPSYGAPIGPSRSPLIAHTNITRPSLTPLPVSTSTAPQLIRTSTLQSPGSAAGSAYNPYAMYPNKAVLKIVGKLEAMAENWTQEEWENRRRIVLFKKQQSGSTLTATFKAVSVNERPPNSVCISCIWWAEKNECFVTSVDTIYLLEQLVAAPSRFTVEEKNRIRRNLEGFRPLTVSKAKPDSEEFFKIIMAFPNPKPRNIEKDVKVFPWKILEQALKKIIGKYSASPSSTIPPAHLSVSTSPYPALPTPPAIGPGGPDAVSAYGISAHHEALASPRSISGVSSLYSYGAPPRGLSPVARTNSPLSSSLRAAPLPPVTTYDSRTMTTSSYATGLHTSLAHPPTTAPPRWDTTPTSYAEPYSSLSAHHASSHQVYGPGAYGEGPSRA